MALVSMRQLLDHAAEHSYGLPAFNVNNLEQMRAIMEAADAVNAPVIVQASAGARKYAGAPFLRHLILAAVEEFPHIPVVMHQDHGASPDVCQRSIQLGFSSVMMDGSLLADGKTPSSYEYNVDVTRTVVNSAIWLRLAAKKGFSPINSSPSKAMVFSPTCVTQQTISVPKRSRSHFLATAPAATRAAVSRAELLPPPR